MKKIIIFQLILFSLFIFSQEKELGYAKERIPLVIIDDIIASERLMYSTDSKDINSVTIYKTVSEKISNFENFTQFGIISIEMKNKLKKEKILLFDLNLKFGLEKNNPIYIDGFLVKNNDVKIYTDAIVETKVIESSYGKILIVWTIKEEERRFPVKKEEIIKKNQNPNFLRSK